MKIALTFGWTDELNFRVDLAFMKNKRCSGMSILKPKTSNGIPSLRYPDASASHVSKCAFTDFIILLIFNPEIQTTKSGGGLQNLNWSLVKLRLFSVRGEFG